MKSRLQGRNPPFSPAGLGRRALHPTQARSSRSQGPGSALQTEIRPTAVARGVGEWVAQGQGSAEPGWRDPGREGCAGAGAPVRAARSICLTHEDPHLLLPEDPRKERGHGEAHGGARGRGHGHGHGGAGWNRPVAGGWGSAAAGGGGAATASARPGPPDVTAAPPPPGRPPPRPAPRPPRGSGSGETEAERVSAARLRAPPARRRKGSGFPT